MVVQAGQEGLRLSERRGRFVLLATVLGSGIAFLDATVINVALPAIGEGTNASLAGLQWTVNGYALALAALILLGGALGDRFGRRRLFIIGTAWFALASLLCGLAPNVELLIGARILQGIGGALLTPSSLALLQGSFAPAERARAIGLWSGLSGIASALGPIVGGWLVDAGSWRWVFILNVPLAVLVIALAVFHVPERRESTASGTFDYVGSVLAAVGLAGVSYALIAAAEPGTPILLPALLGIFALVAFVIAERTLRTPMLPPFIFASRQFTGANLVTLAVYAALSGMFFFLVLDLQLVVGFSALKAGSALLPVTAMMLLLSEPAGRWAAKIGPRIPMTIGPAICAMGVVMLTRIDAQATYLLDVLPGVSVFGVGLAITVAPLTTAVLAAVEDRHAGIASGINNAAARTAGLLAVAALPLLSGLSSDEYRQPAAFHDSFQLALWISAALLVLGAILAWCTISVKLADDR
ncbi:MAG: DHA2 family efflux MFS transporter permease subunit [Corynebacteriales bacterium]|nr:DHA2 family efflux MFS transporter permease subunit [Mycobacteriales bacterium]